MPEVCKDQYVMEGRGVGRVLGNWTGTKDRDSCGTGQEESKCRQVGVLAGKAQLSVQGE